MLLLRNGGEARKHLKIEAYIPPSDILHVASVIQISPEYLRCGMPSMEHKLALNLTYPKEEKKKT